MVFATSCCGIEMMSTSASTFDISRFGSEVFRATPRQSDLMITAGTITYKWPRPWCVCMSKCLSPTCNCCWGLTVTGGMYGNDSYSVVRGVDRLAFLWMWRTWCPLAL
ncbi:MAG: hypothetical protein U0003_02880 [Vampirovibrionales bacterium]